MRRKFFLLLIFVAFGIVSCKTDNPDSENILQKFSVTFDSDGGSKVYNKPKIWTKNSKNSEFAVL